MTNPPKADTGVHHLAESLARQTLRASVSSSRRFAIILIIGGLVGSWLIVYVAGGVNNMVPHWYYIPILFAAARFGAYAALLTAIIAGFVAGPLTPESVALGTTQDAARWLTRTGFFIGIGLLMAWLGGPSLRPFAEEVRDLRKEFRIRKGLAANEFFLRYQPIYSLKNKRCVGFEALVRWQHPKAGELSPAAFIEVAEKSSLIHDLGDFVIEEACRKAAEWNALAAGNDHPPVHIAINLSGRDLEQPDLVSKLSKVLNRYNLSPDHLHIELTESVMLNPGAAFQLRKLRQTGIRIHIDDFGTGYSSLSYLSHFTVDFLKVDRSLIADLAADAHTQTLARCIAFLARKFQLLTVAEGIESDEQLAMALEIGFDFAQGYHLSRPVKEDAVPAILGTRPGESSMAPVTPV